MSPTSWLTKFGIYFLLILINTLKICFKFFTYLCFLLKLNAH
nr:MAG TPA: hypothetical protein [Caudoviricetes sp.]